VVGSKTKSSPSDKGKRRKFSIFSVREGEIDIVFLLLVLVLLVIGLLALFSASFAFAYFNFGSSYAFIIPQLRFAVVGVAAMLLISTIDYRILRPFAWPIFVVTFGLLLWSLTFPHEGARRWINLGFTTLQPSEIAKFAVVVLCAHLSLKNEAYLSSKRVGVKKNIVRGILPYMLVLVAFLVPMSMQPHLSGMILVFSIGLVMMLVGGVDIKWFVLAGILAAIGVVVIISTGLIGYAEGRITSWLAPESDPLGVGFQILQSLYAIGSGGMMGVGVGASRQKYLYLPEPQNDFIFAIVSEEVGFVGATIIILLFALLIWRGFVIALRCKDRFGAMLAIGFISQVGLQTILNIMVVTNTVPNTGISLPFFSYGGTALLMLLGQMGLVLSISRKSMVEKK